MSKETLEEAAVRYSSISFNRQDLYDGFIDGAKWQAENSNINALHFEIDALKREIEILKHQQERMYSEEDMIDFNEWVSPNFPNQHNYLRALQKHNQGLYVPKEKLMGYYSTKELFEQFKKK
jgi:hypothetical protein